jgi:hypothetical protein
VREGCREAARTDSFSGADIRAGTAVRDASSCTRAAS